MLLWSPGFDPQRMNGVIVDPVTQGSVDHLVALDEGLPLESGGDDPRLQMVVGAGEIDDLDESVGDRAPESLGDPPADAGIGGHGPQATVPGLGDPTR